MGQTSTTSPVIAPAQHRPAPAAPMATQPVPPPRTTYKLAPHIRNAPSPAHSLQYAGITQQVSITVSVAGSHRHWEREGEALGEREGGVGGGGGKGVSVYACARVCVCARPPVWLTVHPRVVVDCVPPCDG